MVKNEGKLVSNRQISFSMVIGSSCLCWRPTIFLALVPLFYLFVLIQVDVSVNISVSFQLYLQLDVFAIGCICNWMSSQLLVIITLQ
jgi:hypothetical protein